MIKNIQRPKRDALNPYTADLAIGQLFINDRESYLSMIPVLWELRDRLIEEREDERHFVLLVHQRSGIPPGQIWDAVKWWKFKNKWKRNIRADDAKALRMIEQKIERNKQWPIPTNASPK